MPEVNSVVAMCDSRSQAEEAVKELQKAGFDMTRISIAGDGKTGRVMVICDGPWPGPLKRIPNRPPRGKGSRMPTAA